MTFIKVKFVLIFTKSDKINHKFCEEKVKFYLEKLQIKIKPKALNSSSFSKFGREEILRRRSKEEPFITFFHHRLWRETCANGWSETCLGGAKQACVERKKLVVFDGPFCAFFWYTEKIYFSYYATFYVHL